MPLISEEVWVSRFASQLVAEQPEVDHKLATEVGTVACQYMRNLIPERAVGDFLFFLSQSRESFKGPSSDRVR